MVEELTEEGHPGIERRGQSEVRRYVREVEDLTVIAGPEHAVEPGALDDLDAVLQDIVVAWRPNSSRS